MSNYYKQAIEMITQDKDWYEVVKDYAKRHPADFVRACQSQGWEREAKALMDAGQKIEAIKLCRSMTGASLKDAKDAVGRL